ncbi:4-hydroxy-tetrahydrodipicolinate synthase [Myxococcota bacterium]|nr:4-hydroxy-tetrahydrodipicolinate synthase [Myxococcota bacterium]
MTVDVKKQLKGAFTALVTPFTANDEVDVPSLRRIVEMQISGGIDGLVPCGTTGETPTLTAEERELVVRTTVEVARGRVPIVAGTGSNSTKTTIEATQRAEKWGVQYALVVCPYYNKPTQEGLFRHFKAVHEASGLPIIAYNVPGRTVSDLQPETIARLVEIGAIVAVKDATANMQRATETLNVVDPSKPFSLMSGDDFTILPFVACGGAGVISVVSNIAPGDTAKLVKLTAEMKLAEARPLNGRIVELTKPLFSVSSPIPIKAAMAAAGWCLPNVRLPLDPATPATTELVKAAMHRYRGTTPPASLEGFAC